MNINKLEQALLAKRRELKTEMAQNQAEGRKMSSPELEDREDSIEGVEEAFDASTREWQTYRQVEEALARIDAGTYGKCLECGKQIEDERLEAVPWTPYCLKHQKRNEPKVRSQTM